MLWWKPKEEGRSVVELSVWMEYDQQRLFCFVVVESSPFFDSSQFFWTDALGTGTLQSLVSLVAAASTCREEILTEQVCPCCQDRKGGLLKSTPTLQVFFSSSFCQPRRSKHARFGFQSQEPAER